MTWAANSPATNREKAREILAQERGNRDIAQAFCNEALEAREFDHSRALVGLGLLGEMKSPVGENCFLRFLSVPLPTQGTLVEGEIAERTALATLQAKAVEGLAYLGTPAAREEVLRVIQTHPSRIVRASAIDAFLWNHGDSEEAKKLLRGRVQKEDQILIDRVRRNTGEEAESFNRKLSAFLRAHPEVIPPEPAKLGPASAQRSEDREKRQLPDPPGLEGGTAKEAP